MLLDRSNARRLIMESPVVTKNGPTLWPYDMEPFVILNVLRKPVLLIVMMLNGKWWLCLPESLRKAFAEATIKIEG
jgi:hypothetical protein